MATINNLFDGFKPAELLTNLISGEYFELVFPFLLIFAMFYTVLSSEKIKLFRNNEKLNKAGVFIISLSVSLFSVYFETSSGFTIGKMLSLLFPNISTLTILLLSLYIIGSLFGQNFFHNLFGKRNGAFAHFAVGGLGLGSVVFYVGMAMGMFNYDPYNFAKLYNVTLFVALAILAIVFLLIRLYGLGLILIFVLGIFMSNGGEGFILEYFLDPVVFIGIIIIFLLTWMGTEKDKKFELKRNLKEQKESMESYEKRNGGKPNDHVSKTYDITSSGFEMNKKKWNNSYPSESWE